MADFDRAYGEVLKNEGGYVNHPADRGGETYKGIARNMQKGWAGWAIIDREKTQAMFPSRLEQNQELQSLVRGFYRTQFWNVVRGDAITHQSVANMLFDFSVNMGISAGVQLVQRACVILGKAISVDGVVGGGTLNAVNSLVARDLVQVIKACAAARYLQLVEGRIQNRAFIKGWLNRAGIQW